MRHSLLFVCLLSAFVISCSKGNTGGGTTPPPPPPPPNGGTTGNGALTLTGISPVKLYQGEVITINGTGFDADKTKDTVYIGVVDAVQKQFRQMGFGAPFFPVPKTTIVSATSTQLQITTDAQANFTDAEPLTFALEVHSPSGILVIPDTIFLKVLPRIIRVTATNPYPKPVCGSLKIFSGDSILIEGVGFYPPLTVTIDGKAMDYSRYFTSSPDYNSTYPVNCFIGIDFFGTQTPPFDASCGGNKDFDKIIKIVNGDGKIATFSSSVNAGPNSQILDCHLDNTGPSKKHDGSVLLTMSGYAVRNFTIDVAGTDPATHTPFIEHLSSFAGDLSGPFSASIDLGALPNPDAGGTNFQIQVKDGNGNSVGGAVMTLYP
jgi:IPT/TIG domain